MDKTLNQYSEEFYNFFTKVKRFVDIKSENFEIFITPVPIHIKSTGKFKKETLYIGFTGFSYKKDIATYEIYIPLLECTKKSPEIILKKVIKELKKVGFYGMEK